ncbi:MAG: hypothetical protein GX220_04305 [Treponema sp.]|nr:hypothetical protein [Treponema sp.]
MKKIALIFVILSFFSVLAFAEGKANHQVFVGFQYRWENFETEMFKDYFVKLKDGEAKIKDVFDTSGAITVGLATFNRSAVVGLYNSIAVTIPYYTTINNVIEYTEQEMINIKDHLGEAKFYGMGVDWIIGPGFNFMDLGLVKIPVVIGGHVYGDIDWTSGESPAFKLVGGIGGNIGVEVHLFGLNVFAQCQFAYDFYGMVWAPNNTFSHGKAGVFSLMPQIGIGLKF